MTPTEARRLSEALANAALAAERAGSAEIDLLEQLRAEDDTARAALEEAIRQLQPPKSGD